MTSKRSLQRSVSLPFLVLYGVGTMVGGGIFALIGEISVDAKGATPFALLLSGAIAFLSACSFAELSSRFPVSAGEARYVQEGFGRFGLAALVGWLVIATGVVSAATLAVATTGFIRDLWTALPELPTIIALVLLFGAVAAWGIGESVAVVAVITVIEVGALLFAFGVNAESLGGLPDRWPELLPGDPGGATWLGVFGGAFLALYAFIGFEDMVNIAEEVRDVERSLPFAILLSVGLTTLLYVAIAIVSVLSGPIERLSDSATPIAELVRGSVPGAMLGVSIVSILTGINGALVQIIMASRVAYGLAKRDKAPNILSRVSPLTRTPVIATVLVTAIVLALATAFPLATLARITSAIILAVFALVSLALWRIKRKDPDLDGQGPRFPAWVPLLAFAVTLSVLLFKLSLTFFPEALAYSLTIPGAIPE